MGEPLVRVLPEPPRLDRHDTYVAILIYVWLGSIGIYLLPLGTGPISGMDPMTQKLLAVCMFIGSTLCLAGSAMGTPGNIKITKPFRWLLQRKWVAKIRHHPYEPLPLRHCYRLGIAGLVACVTAFGFFSAQLLTTGSIIGSMTGMMPPILVIAWTRKARKFWHAATIMDKNYEARKKER